MITYNTISQRMNGGRYLSTGNLGECPLIEVDHDYGNGTKRFVATLFIWRPEFNDSAKVAGWFHALGATRVWVTHVLYSDCNGGREPEGMRTWLVYFDAPTDAVQALDPPERPTMTDLSRRDR